MKIKKDRERSREQTKEQQWRYEKDHNLKTIEDDKDKRAEEKSIELTRLWYHVKAMKINYILESNEEDDDCCNWIVWMFTAESNIYIYNVLELTSVTNFVTN